MLSSDLIEGESIVLESDMKAVSLTTHRIRQEIRESGRYKLISIMLDQVSSCEINRKSNPVILFLALILLVGGLFTLEKGVSFSGGLSQASGIMFLLSLMFFVIYLLARSQVVSISSASTKIVFSTSGMKKEKCVQFVDKVESTRMDFLGKYLK